MKKNWQKLTQKKIIFLTNYYIILLLMGMVFTIGILSDYSCMAQISIQIKAIIGGIGTALIGNTIFYLRKLYKACIKLEIHSPTDESGMMQSFGVFMYYLLRPIFACAFAILIILSLNVGISNIAVDNPKLNNGFAIMVMFLSFFGGFAAGDFVTLIEMKSGDMLNSIIDKDNSK